MSFPHTRKLSHTDRLLATFIAMEADDSVPSTVTTVKGKRGKKRRKRFTDVVRKTQVKEAVNNFRQTQPQQSRKVRSMPWSNKHLSGFQYEPQIDYSRDKVVHL